MEQKTALQVIERGGYLPMQQATPEAWGLRRKEFNDWVNTQLRDGIDYGNIPTVDKPTLFKPGAEKIVQLFGCLPDTVVTHRESDAATGYLYLEVTVELISLQTGLKVGAGIGSCSSFESKYRWRYDKWYSKGEPPENQGWALNKWGKWTRRIPNPDLADVWNTIVKMAKKRALVDAALTISGASEKFTQDVEDMPTQETEQATQPKRAAQPAPKQADPPTAEQAGPQQAETQSWTTDKTQAPGFMMAWKGKGLSDDEIHLNLNVTHLADYKDTIGTAAKILQAYLDKKAVRK